MHRALGRGEVDGGAVHPRMSEELVVRVLSVQLDTAVVTGEVNEDIG
jgi:hypothetical protein